MAEFQQQNTDAELPPEQMGLTRGALEGYQIIAQKRGIKTYEFEFKPISAPGDNSYGLVLEVKLIPTSMKRDGVELAPTLISVIKMSPKHPVRRQYTRVVDYYIREIFMYNQVLPTFAKLERKYVKNPAERFDPPPKVLHFSLEDFDEYIIFEDLRLKNYFQNPRFKMPDFNLVEKAMISLARFHSLSFVMQYQQENIFNKWVKAMKDNLFSDLKPYSLEFGKRHVDHMRKIVAEEKIAVKAKEEEDELKLEIFKKENDLLPIEPHPDGTKHSKKRRNSSSVCKILGQMLDVVYANFDAICVRCVTGKRNKPFSVICHGDFWNNNIMYRLDSEGNAESAKLIDFQMARYGVPVIDIIHYLFSCTEKELRDEYFKEFVDIYHRALGQHLKHFDLNLEKIYSANVYKNQLAYFGIYGFCMASFCVPFFISNASETLDLTKLSKWAASISDKLPESFAELEIAKDDAMPSGSKQANQASPEHKVVEEDDNEQQRRREEKESKIAEIAGDDINFINSLEAQVKKSKEFEVLTERTLPIFKKRMIGVMVDLVEYNLLKLVKLIVANKEI